MTKKKASKTKGKGSIQVTGRTIAYTQTIVNGKLGKPKPVLITTARVLGAEAPGAPAPTVKRRKKRSSSPSYY